MAGNQNVYIYVTQPGLSGLWSGHEAALGRRRLASPLPLLREPFYDYVEGLGGSFRDVEPFDDLVFEVETNGGGDDDNATAAEPKVGEALGRAHPVMTVRGRRCFRRVYCKDFGIVAAAIRDQKARKQAAKEEEAERQKAEKKYKDDQAELDRNYKQSIEKLEREYKEREDKERQRKQKKQVRYRPDGSAADAVDRVWVEAPPFARYSVRGKIQLARERS